MENGPGLKMYFLLKMVIFQPAMLVYQRVHLVNLYGKLVGNSTVHPICGGRFGPRKTFPPIGP